MQLRSPTVVLLAVLAAAPLPAAAQDQPGLTLQQVEAKYPRMKSVHILKCDFNGDGDYNKSEMMCVANIYQQMYVAR